MSHLRGGPQNMFGKGEASLKKKTKKKTKKLGRADKPSVCLSDSKRTSQISSSGASWERRRASC